MKAFITRGRLEGVSPAVIVLKENIVGMDIVKEDATEMTNVQREDIAMH